MRIAVVDDDNDCASLVVKNIKEVDTSYEIDIHNSGKSFLESNLNDYKIIFLDIELGDSNGVEIGRTLKNSGCGALIFYVTNYDSYISDALINQPFQYLRKPIDSTLFKAEFQRAIQELKKSIGKIKLTWKGAITSILIKDIMYVEVVRRNLNFVLKNDKSILSAGKISKTRDNLKEYGFIVCHKSFLVNMRFISEIKKTDITLTSGNVIPLSKNCLSDVKKRYNFYLARVSL